MNKRIFALASFLMVFVAYFSTFAYAASSGTASDTSIDRVNVNGETIAEGKTNFLEDNDNLDAIVSLTANKDVDNVFVQAILTDSGSGNTISDSTGTFSLKSNQNTLVALRLQLIDNLKRQKNFNLEIRVVDTKDNSEEKSFGIRFTGKTRGAGNLDVSIDRVIVNSKAVAESSTNFVGKANEFDVVVELTALEDLTDAHVETILKDLRTGSVVADVTNTFNLNTDSSTSAALKLELINELKNSNRFDLTVKIVDSEGNSLQKAYGLVMRNKGATAGSAGGGISRQLEISIDSVDIEDKILAENENNFVSLDRSKKKLELRTRLTALENIKDAHVDAVLAFENGNVVADATATFDIDSGQNLVKDVEIPLISQFEQNNFKLKVRVTNADGDSEEKSYGLIINEKKFPFVISSISLSPDDKAEAGKALVATLNFKNSGVLPLDGINAKVSIPELGVSSTKFVGQIKNSNLPEVKEDFILKLLDNVPTGTYTVKSEITSQFSGESEVKEIPVFIVGKSEQPQKIASDKLLINVPIAKQDIKNDGSEAIYTLTLTNEGPDANAYTLLLDGANWADLRLSDSNVFVIKPKESKTVDIFASASGNPIGEQIFLVAIKSNGNVLKQIPLKANVIAAKGVLAAKLKDVLEIMLIGMVVLIVIIGIFFVIRRYIQGNGGNASEMPDQEQGEAYY